MDHRLHDFALLGRAIYAAAGRGDERFDREFDRMRKAAGADLAAGDGFITALCNLLGEYARRAKPGQNLPGYKTWFPNRWAAVRPQETEAVIAMRPSFLVDQLQNRIGFNIDWRPKNERELAGALLRAAPVLADIGIRVEKRQPSAGHSYWEFSTTSEAGNE